MSKECPDGYIKMKEPGTGKDRCRTNDFPYKWVDLLTKESKVSVKDCPKVSSGVYTVLVLMLYTAIGCYIVLSSYIITLYAKSKSSTTTSSTTNSVATAASYLASFRKWYLVSVFVYIGIVSVTMGMMKFVCLTYPFDWLLIIACTGLLIANTVLMVLSL